MTVASPLAARKMARYCGTSFTPGAKLNASPRISRVILFLRFIRMRSSVHARGTASRSGRNSSIASRDRGTTCSPVLPCNDDGIRMSRLMSEVTGSSVSPRWTIPSRETPSRSSIRTGCSSFTSRMIRSRFRSERASIWPSRKRSTPRMTRGFVCRGLNRFSYRLVASPSLTPSKDVRNLIASSEVRLSNFAARLLMPRMIFPRQPLARDVVDDLAALVGAEGPHAFVEHVDVVAPPAGEDEPHGLFFEPEVRPQEVVVQVDDFQADRLEHLRVRHLRGVGQVVRVEIEDQVGPEPPLLVHRRGVRVVVVRARVVGVSRHTRGEEGLQLLLLPEPEMPLHDARGPEHESELPPAEAVRQGRLHRVIVPVELVPQEVRRGLLRGVCSRHHVGHRGRGLKGWRGVRGGTG